MLNKLILFLIRVKLGLKKNQLFRFSNQKTENLYYINDAEVVKCQFIRIIKPGKAMFRALPSNVSINWLLHSNCKIKKFNKNYNSF